MKLASSCTKFVDIAEKNIDRILNRAISEEKSRIYINVLSDVKAFIRNMRIFINTLKNLEDFFPDLRYGRICFRWIYAEHGNIISLVKLEPKLSISFAGDRLKISCNSRAVTLYSTSSIGFIVNQYNDTLDLGNEEDVISKRSLLLDAIAITSQYIEKAIENLNLCIKYAKHRV